MGRPIRDHTELSEGSEYLRATSKSLRLLQTLKPGRAIDQPESRSFEAQKLRALTMDGESIEVKVEVRLDEEETEVKPK